MRCRSQERLRGLCLILLALPALGCGDEPAPPAGPDPAASLPVWARCEHWKRRDGSCDPAVLLSDYEECLRTEGVPDMRRLAQAGSGRLAMRREGERKTIVCLQRRHWMMKPSGLQNLPGRRTRTAPPT